MPEPDIGSRDPYAIVPGEDELLARPRPGQRPVKRVSWPGVLLALLALAGVIALAAFYANDRQQLLSSNGRYQQQLQQATRDIEALQHQQAALADKLNDHQHRLDALPNIEPQRLDAMDVQLGALGVALRALQQQSSDANAADTQQAPNDQQHSLGFRLAALEDQLHSLNERVSSLESGNASH
ncbi:hypothetical protein [Carnimonas bestiolae]|uniref:hypothetical protein n=1 Tax=Carnimonas bestiolae TaxID=3402172 RepID=UPI003EDC0F80